MHRPAAVEAAPSTERRWECSHKAIRRYSAAARTPVYAEAGETCAGQSMGGAQTASSLATTTDLLNLQQ